MSGKFHESWRSRVLGHGFVLARKARVPVLEDPGLPQETIANLKQPPRLTFSMLQRSKASDQGVLRKCALHTLLPAQLSAGGLPWVLVLNIILCLHVPQPPCLLPSLLQIHLQIAIAFIYVAVYEDICSLLFKYDFGTNHLQMVPFSLGQYTIPASSFVQ